MPPPANQPTAALVLGNVRILRLFISYAHEDAKIAIAVSNELQAVLSNVLSEIFVDKVSLETGFDFQRQIEDRLDSTDILIIIYTGVQKASHGFTGYEVGYFRRVQRASEGEASIPRRIVPIFLDVPPATAATMQGIGLGIDHDTLTLSEDTFKSEICDRVGDDHPMVLFLNELHAIEEQLRERGGFPERPWTREGCNRMCSRDDALHFLLSQDYCGQDVEASEADFDNNKYDINGISGERPASRCEDA